MSQDENTKKRKRERKDIIWAMSMPKRKKGGKAKPRARPRATDAELDALEPRDILGLQVNNKVWMQFETLCQRYQGLHPKIQILIALCGDFPMRALMKAGRRTTNASLIRHAGVFWATLSSFNQELMYCLLHQTEGSLSRCSVYTFYHELTKQKDREDLKRTLQQVLAMVYARVLTTEKLQEIAGLWDVTLYKTWFFMYGDSPCGPPSMGTFKSMRFGRQTEIVDRKVSKKITCDCIVKGYLLDTLDNMRKQLRTHLASLTEYDFSIRVFSSKISPTNLHLDLAYRDQETLVPLIQCAHFCGHPLQEDAFWLVNYQRMSVSEQWDHLIAESLDVNVLDDFLENKLPKDIARMIVEFLHVEYSPGTPDDKLGRLCQITSN
jgi:hypothetical protein